MKPKRVEECGCCEVGIPPTPEEIHNRPGLLKIVYRVGTFGSFRQAMVEAIAKSPDLKNWTTRQSDDYGIALIEMWAYLADILTFYQERIANEAFLRTALHRDTVLRLAAMLDYELNPGLAATAYLVFFAEEGSKVNIPVGLRVQSVPGQDEKPQKFETVEQIIASAEANRLNPQLSRAQKIGRGCRRLYLKGVDNQLQPGDAILLVGETRKKYGGSERWDFRILQSVTPHPEQGHTLVTWDRGLGHEKPTVDPADKPEVFVFRQRAALFGYNAPDWRLMPDAIKKIYAGSDWQTHKQWPGFEIGENNQVYLDAVYPKILKDSWVVLMKPGYVELYQATNIAVDAKTDFTLSAQTTRIDLDVSEHLSWFPRRDTVVFAQSERLVLANEPLPRLLSGNKIVLDRLVQGLKKSQVLMISGKRLKLVKVAEDVFDLSLVANTGTQRASLKPGDLLQAVGVQVLPNDQGVQWQLIDANGFAGFVVVKSEEIIPQPATEDDEFVNEVAFIESVYDDHSATIMLQTPLKNLYDLGTVNIYANVAKVTHGETVSSEVLGSGEASREFQEFALKKSPITFVPAPNAPRGAKNTLEIRIGGVLWEEVASLYGQRAGDRVYITRVDDDNKMTVQFGDGRTGARLPSGRDNVLAQYRQGLGSEGNVRANSLTTLLDRPVGLKSVNNPTQAEGGAPPESLQDTRINAPHTVRTFERAISLHDYEDLARSYMGIAKAKASRILSNENDIIQLTIAGEKGGKIERTSETYKNFLDYLNLHRDTNHLLEVVSHSNRLLVLKAVIQLDPAYWEEEVLSAARTAALDYFDFNNLQFGQGIHLSAIYAILQKVGGVAAVRIEYLDYKEKNSASTPLLQPHLRINPNQIATLKEDDLQITSNLTQES